MSVSAREAALKLLNDSEGKTFQSGFAVERINTGFGLDDKDAALAVNIYLGCIQYRYRLDHYIACCSDMPPEKIDSCVRNILRMAVYQLAFLDRIPAHAAVDEAVKLCRKQRPRASSFVNAVLRHFSAERDHLPPVGGTAAERLSTEYSTEKWFAEYLIENHGEAFAEAFLKSSNEEAPLSLRVNTLKTTVEEYKELLDKSGIGYKESAFEGILLIASGGVKELPGYDEGLFYIQDPAAAACAAIARIEPGQRVFDACASPGGKSFSASMAMGNEGSILSCDINEKKTAKISEGAKRLGADIISCAAADAKKYDPSLDSAFDTVLADVPCSGFGVLRKKPEIKYKPYEEIASLPEIQRSIIDNLSRYVKPGGVLLYSTCTVLREENEAVVESFLREHEDFKAADFCCCGISSKNGMYTFWPNTDGTDGFFAAKLYRIR